MTCFNIFEIKKKKHNNRWGILFQLIRHFTGRRWGVIPSTGLFHSCRWTKKLFSSLSYLPHSRTANLNHGMIIVNTY